MDGCGPVSSALRLLAFHLTLSLQTVHHGLSTATCHTFPRQVLEGALSRTQWAPERLLQGLLIQVRVQAGVLLDGGHAGAVQRGVVSRAGAQVLVGAGRWRRAALLGARHLETQPGRVGGAGEGWRLQDPDRCGLQAAQELSILGK